MRKASMKITFIHPASGKLELAENNYLVTGAYLPPLGILYLAKMLELKGHSVNVIDCNAAKITKNQIKKAALTSDVIGMTVYSQPLELNNSIMLSQIVKSTNPDMPLVIGGPHSSLLPKKTLQDLKADVCVKGSGENVINPIINALQQKKSLASIPGICYRKGTSVKDTGPEREIHNLDTIPFPSRHLVDKYEYGYMLGKKMGMGKVTSLTSSRGCVYRCRFCNLHAHLPHWSHRSIENICREIDEIAAQGYDTLVFVDDNFMVDTKRVAAIMDYIIKNKINLRFWIFGARADSGERKLYEKMRDAGVELINFGLESGNQKVLNYYNKNLKLEDVRKTINLSKEMGFFISSTFIIGSPVETKQTIFDTINFAKSLTIDAAIFYLYTYTYKSQIWEEAVKDDLIKSDEYRVLPDSKRGLGNFTTDELMDLVVEANKCFYLNPKRWFREIKWAIMYRKLWYLKLGIRLLPHR